MYFTVRWQNVFHCIIEKKRIKIKVYWILTLLVWVAAIRLTDRLWELDRAYTRPHKHNTHAHTHTDHLAERCLTFSKIHPQLWFGDCSTKEMSVTKHMHVGAEGWTGAERAKRARCWLGWNLGPSPCSCLRNGESEPTAERPVNTELRGRGA